MTQPVSTEALIRALEARIAKLEQVLQVKNTAVVLQYGQAKVTLANNGITLDATGNIEVNSHGGAVIRASADAKILAGNNIVMKAIKILEN